MTSISWPCSPPDAFEFARELAFEGKETSYALRGLLYGYPPETSVDCVLAALESDEDGAAEAATAD